MKKIAIVGIVSSGKSTVCRFFEECGAYILKADDIVHNLLSLDPFVIRKVRGLFGTDVFFNGTIDRKKIAEQVFDDFKKLDSLEMILYPIIVSIVKKTYRWLKSSFFPYHSFVTECPFLFKTKLFFWFDTIVEVLANKAICKKRFLSKMPHPQQFEKRYARFLTMQTPPFCPVTLENNCSLKHLQKQAHAIFRNLL